MQAALSFALALVLSCQAFDLQGYERKTRECFEFLSGYVNDRDLKAPEFPFNLEKVTLYYREPGCNGDCPVFRLKLTEKKVEFQGTQARSRPRKEKREASAGRVRATD